AAPKSTATAAAPSTPAAGQADHTATPTVAAPDSAGNPAANNATPANTGPASKDADAGNHGATPMAGGQVGFIDGNVPDLDILVAGVQPGIQVVVLDPNGNGVQQIADYLSSHDAHDLDAIQIVSHGEDATVRLGNTILGLADISMFKDQLATIGQSLKPGG